MLAFWNVVPLGAMEKLRTPIPIEPHVKIEAQGRLLLVRTVGAKEGPRKRQRGDIVGFSHNSRMRLLRKFSRLQSPDHPGYRSKVTFLTLTTRAHLHPRVLKRLAQKLFKRISRKYPRLAIIWRLEFQKRGAPHLHCVLYNAPWVDRLWLVSSWSILIEQANPIVDLRRVTSHRQLTSYVSKYVAKVTDSTLLDIGTKNAVQFGRYPGMKESVGRIWGVWNADSLPFDVLERASVPLGGSWWMIRQYCRKFYDHISEDDYAGFTVFTDNPYHALQHIVGLSKSFGAYTLPV